MKLREIVKISNQSFIKNGTLGLKNLFLSYLNLQREAIHVSSLPIMIQIEPTLYCNLECKMCINPYNNRKKCHMRIEEFKKIINDIPFVRKINLVGVGEPLMNPEIFDMVLYAKSKGILIGFATNATLMEQKVAEKIISTKVDWLNISLDGATKKTYEEIRRGANFEIVVQNVKNLMSMLDRQKTPEVSIWFLLMKSNFLELPKVVELAEEVGVRNISVQSVHCWGSADWKRKMFLESIESEIGGVKEALSESVAIAKTKHIRFCYVNIPDKSKRRACQWPWKSCYITSDGYITPCCMHGSNPEIIHFGNVFRQRFGDIWNNQLYCNFRKALKSESVPSLCVDCTSYYTKVEL